MIFHSYVSLLEGKPWESLGFLSWFDHLDISRWSKFWNPWNRGCCGMLDLFCSKVPSAQRQLLAAFPWAWPLQHFHNPWKIQPLKLKSRKVCAKIFVSQNLVKAIIWGAVVPPPSKPFAFVLPQWLLNPAKMGIGERCTNGTLKIIKWQHQQTNGDLMVI